MKRKYDVVFPFFATLFFILTLSVTVLAQSAQSTAEKPTADSFGVEDASGQSGTYVEVPVNIMNVRNGPVQGIRIRVDYNESVLSLTSISEGDLTLNWTHLQLGEDRHTMTIATAYTGDAIPDGSSGSVVLLNFHVIGSPGDKSPMNLSLIELSNPDGIVVGTAPAMNGTFTIKLSAEQPTPTPASPPSTGAGDGGGGFASTAPTPTQKQTAVEGVAITPALTTPAPTITPPSTAPTPAPAPTTLTPAPVPGLPPLFLILIVTAVIVIAGIIIVVLRRK